MSLPRRLKKNQPIDIADLYALRLGPLWRAFKAEHLSLWMLCIYFFFEYVRPQSIYPAIDFLPWGQIFLFLTIIFGLQDKTAHWRSNPINRWMIIFALVVVLSGIFAFKPALSLAYWAVFGGWFILYFLIISIVNTEKRMLLFLLAYCLFNFKMSQHGAVVWALRGFSFASYGINGPSGWFHNSGEYAIQMLIFGPLAVAIILSLKEFWGRNKKWFFYAAAITAYMAIVGASSRGAQVAMVVTGVWLLLKQRGGFKGLIVVGFIAGIFFYLLPNEQIARFEQMGEDRESLQRLTYWEYAISDVIPNNPVLGVGYNNWLSYISYLNPDGMGPMKRNQESHNIYIQAASELGLVGLMSFLLLITFAFVNNRRTRKMASKINNKLLFNLTYGLDAGLIGYLVASSFVTVLYYPFFWIQIAMIVMANSVTKNLYEKN
jgi:putative inorganic carbon (HCO3(-)) transporter